MALIKSIEHNPDFIDLLDHFHKSHAQKLYRRLWVSGTGSWEDRIQLFPSIILLIVKLANEWADHALKWLLASIVEVEVEVDEGLRVEGGAVEILNYGGAKYRLTTSRDAMKP